MSAKLKRQIEQLEGQVQVAEAESPRERISRENHERVMREYEGYLVICDKILATIPEEYWDVVNADIESHTQAEFAEAVYGGGFIGGRWGIELSPLLRHVFTMARLYQKAQLYGSAAYGYDGPLVVPAATCAILVGDAGSEVEFNSVGMGRGWQCKECRYWLPVAARKPDEPVGGWGQPMLPTCPCCGGEPVDFSRRHEIKRREAIQ